MRKKSLKIVKPTFGWQTLFSITKNILMHISSVVTFSVAKTEVGEMGISALFLPLLPYSIIYLKLPKNFIFTNGLHQNHHKRSLYILSHFIDPLRNTVCAPVCQTCVTLPKLKIRKKFLKNSKTNFLRANSFQYY